jgi:hypothetical protein
MNATVSSFHINPSLLNVSNQSSNIALASGVKLPPIYVKGAFSILSKFFLDAIKSSLFLKLRSPNVFPFSISKKSDFEETQYIFIISAGTFVITPIIFRRSNKVVFE